MMWTSAALGAVAFSLLFQSVSSQTTSSTNTSLAEDCRVGDGESYRGTTSVTNTGKTCQRWDSHTPHAHGYTPDYKPLAGLEQNYCRNPDSSGGDLWCYTTDPGTRWEYCDVPICACDIRLTGDNGTFASTDYPNNYPNSHECRYTISVTPPKVVRLTFTDFNLEENHDYLYVYDGNTTDEIYLIGKLHGENIPLPRTSSGSVMTVRFVSDIAIKRKGFQANYAAVDKVLAVCEVGEYLCADGVTCIAAWKRCDGNNDCRDGSDEDTSKCACENIPPSLEMCKNLEYRKMTLPNPLNYAHTTVEEITTLAKYSKLETLSKSSCHPHVKYLVCATIVPRCNSRPNRQLLPCRSWCEEVKYSCRKESAWSAFPGCEIFPHTNCNNIRPTKIQGVECFHGNGANYRGNEARDPIGEGDCTRWDEDLYPKLYPWANLVDNKCRNPIQADHRPWCFTSSGFEYCDILPCDTTIKGCKDPGKPLFGQRSPVLKFYWPDDRITYTCDTGYKFPKGAHPNTARCVKVNESTGEVAWETPRPRCEVDQKFQLQKNLLSPIIYDKEVSPTTSLHVKAYVVNIINLDEKSEQIVTSYKAEWSWHDDRLTWDPDRYRDVDHIFVRDERVWKPTLTLERNADKDYSGGFPNTEVRMESNGEVTWPIAALTTTTCTLDPFLFPQDNMTCAVCWVVGEDYTIGCANLTTHGDIKIKNRHFLNCENLEADIVTGEWSGKTTLKASNNEACLMMTLKRDPTYHYSTTISPCLILIILMIITFIMPIDKGDRVGFGVTVLLSMVVSLVVVTGFLPVSSTLPFIAMLIIVCMALMALFMLWTVFIIIIHDKKGPLPKWARTVFLKHMARALFMGDLTKKLKKEEPTGDAFKNKVKDIEAHTNHAFKMDGDAPSAGRVNPPPNVKNEVGATLIGLRGSVDELEATVQQLSASIDALAQASSGDDDEEVAEYALLAKVLDRLGLVFYIVAIAVAIPCTLLIGRKRVIPS